MPGNGWVLRLNKGRRNTWICAGMPHIPRSRAGMEQGDVESNALPLIQLINPQEGVCDDKSGSMLKRL